MIFVSFLIHLSAMMAKQINKNDLNAVTATDTVGFYNEVAFSQAAPTTASLAYIDYPNGDLTKTAIAAIAATASDNKVYIVNRGTVLVILLRQEDGKRFASFAMHLVVILCNMQILPLLLLLLLIFRKMMLISLNIFHLKMASVPVEPAKKKWDIAWTYFSNVTNFGSGEVPYLFQDIILLNRNVQVAKVMVTAKAFADFAEADIAGQTFLTSQNAIGSDWRSGGGPELALL